MRSVIWPVLCSMLVVLLMTGLAFSAEPDDSNLFVEAFNAFHKKDYLLTIEKLDLLHQVFPDTPLRDISLLLLARAGLKSGDNERAAKTVNLFTNEFPESNLTASIEEELLNLAKRQKKGEKLQPVKHLKAAAQKVRDDQQAMERAAALKAEQERLTREKAELARVAREKADAERRERERIAAEKAARESIQLAVSVPQDMQIIQAGTSGRIPFELHNKGKEREEFVLSSPLPAEFSSILTSIEKEEVPLRQIALAGGEIFKGMIVLNMPKSRVDGYKITIPLNAVSKRFSDVQFSKNVPVTASAPLVRAVARPLPSMVTGGETVTYRIMVLNAGTQPARQLTVRVILPQQVELAEASGNHQKEADRVFSFNIDNLETGMISEFSLKVRVKKDVAVKQELRCQVEVVNGHLQLKDVFTSAVAVVRAR